jgi:DNA-binding NarL/FixJ family response regulator
MKSILVVCDHSHIDVPLRRSLAHLVKSCEIKIASDGYQTFGALKDRVFDLIIIDFEIAGIDSMELLESIEYIDPGVPTILMVKKRHKAIWSQARHLKANPILRPFKPLTFLRLVDILLHQQLERYRELGHTLQSILERLCTQTEASLAFLVDGSGQLLIATSEAEHVPIEQLAKLAATKLATNATGFSKELAAEDEALITPEPTEKNHELYLTTIVQNLNLALIAPVTGAFLTPSTIWAQVDIAAMEVKRAFYENAFVAETSSADTPPSNEEDVTNAREDADQNRVLVPLKLNIVPTLVSTPAQDTGEDEEEDEVSVNWQIISNDSNVLSRLADFCQVIE